MRDKICDIDLLSETSPTKKSLKFLPYTKNDMNHIDISFLCK